MTIKFADRCSYNLRDPGIYRVTGEISRSPYHPVCSTFINSPAGETLNVTFLSVNILCGMGGAMVGLSNSLFFFYPN